MDLLSHLSLSKTHFFRIPTNIKDNGFCFFVYHLLQPILQNYKILSSAFSYFYNLIYDITYFQVLVQYNTDNLNYNWNKALSKLWNFYRILKMFNLI